MRANKLVVTGAGHVGAQVLTEAMHMGLFGEIAVIDANNSVAIGEALDSRQATGAPHMAAIDVHPGDAHDYDDADVVICAAGPSIVPDPDDPTGRPDRSLVTTVNAAVIRQVMGDIAAHTDRAIVILITNPLDTMVHIAATEFGYPEHQVFGTGTMLDSTRLRQIIAEHCRVAPSSVQGYMMGEHGMSAFPVLSRLTVGGYRFNELPEVFPIAAEVGPEEIREQVVQAAYDVFNSKGWTNAGIAQSAVSLARTVMLDEHAIHPVCTTLRGEYGHDGDVALSMPCLIARGGVERRLAVPLDEWETEHLELTIASIRATMAQAGTGQ